MADFSIGLSGLTVAQRAIEIVSTNIANATTEGYHRQEPTIRALALNATGDVAIGGAEITEVRRLINNFLETEITRQDSSLSEAAEELEMLEMIENALGDVGSEGLAAAMGKFFDSLTELGSDPSSLALRTQVVGSAEAMADEFRRLGQFLMNLEGQVQRRAEEYVGRVNALALEIADLNEQVDAVAIRQGSANLLLDRRDAAIAQLAELAPVQVISGQEGSQMVRINIWTAPIVSRSSVNEMQVAMVADGKLGITVGDSGVYRTDVRGGRIGAMLTLKNEVLSDLRERLDTLAEEFISAMNRLHVQGLGTTGSFTKISGLPVSPEPLGDWTAEITPGSFYVRLVDTDTGLVIRHEITVDVTDTVSDIRDRIDAVDGLSATIVSAALTITADSGYEFDFLPAVLGQPYTSTITGDAVPTMSGVYTGEASQVFTCTVVGAGDVGVADNLKITVLDGDSNLVNTINVGSGYAAGDRVEAADGIYLSLSAGTLNDSDEFTIQALAESDTSGFLAAAGVNTLFSGNSAWNIAVREDVLLQPQRLGTAAGAELTDTLNLQRMAEFGRQTHAALNEMTPHDCFRSIVMTVADGVMVRRARSASLENVQTRLRAQRDEISGVDINEEAAKLIVLERMYHAVARSIATQDQALEFLFDIIR